MSEPFGRYQLLKRIAAGGMGEVFLARQEGIQGFEKLLVIKTLLPHLSQQRSFTDMFLDEARIAARLAHPNVVQIFDLGEEQGIYYIAMEYVHGDELRRVWKQVHKNGEAFPVPLSVRIISDAAAGLGYAHRLTDAQGNKVGLVHRDVSPHNILITFDGSVKLIDFGVAKAAGRLSSTQAGTLKGKYAYMSPEQVDGEEIDSRSDVFSLGIVLWEILTGSRLFKRESETQTMRAVSDCAVVPPSVKNPAVPVALDPIVMKALAQNRDQRYATAEQLRMDLEEWLSRAHMQGSAAHLGEFMQKEFKERLEKEGTKGALWDVDPAATGFSPLGGSRPPRPVGGEGSGSDTSLKSLAQNFPFSDGDPSSPSLPGARPRSRELTPATAIHGGPGAKKSRTPLLVAGCVAAAGIGVAVVVWPHAPAPTVVQHLPAPPVAPSLEPAKPPPEPAKPATATLSVTSEPPGAKILDGDTPIGTTPADLILPRSRAAVNLTLQLAGYKPSTHGVDLAAAPVERPTALHVKLEALPAAAKHGDGKPKKKKEDEVKTFE